MRYREIIRETDEEDFDTEIDEFDNTEIYLDELLDEMAKKCDPKVVDFLFENHLYRAQKADMYWGPDFGISAYPKKRKPVDTPAIIQEIVDDYLRKRGFEALRSNSIFCTGKVSTASKYLKTSKSDEEDQNYIMVIFPQKDFHFTWNPKIEDFYLEGFKEDHVDIFDFNYEELLKTHEGYEELKFMFEDRYEEGNYQEDLLKEILNNIEKKNFGKAVDSIEKYMNLLKKDYPNDYFYIEYDLLNRITLDFSSEKIKEIVKIDENSIMKYYTNKNFEQAVKSGNEIMITNKLYFYFRNNFFYANSYMIKEKLDEKFKKLGKI